MSTVNWSKDQADRHNAKMSNYAKQVGISEKGDLKPESRSEAFPQQESDRSPIASKQGKNEGKLGRSKVDGESVVKVYNGMKEYRESLTKQVNPYILAICDELGRNSIPFQTEFQFNPERKWRFDVFVKIRTFLEVESGTNHTTGIGVEFNGGQWVKSRHTLGMGYWKDLQKLNSAQILGYKVLQYTTSDFQKNGRGAKGVVEDIKRILES